MNGDKEDTDMAYQMLAADETASATSLSGPRGVVKRITGKNEHTEPLLGFWGLLWDSRGSLGRLEFLQCQDLGCGKGSAEQHWAGPALFPPGGLWGIIFYRGAHADVLGDVSPAWVRNLLSLCLRNTEIWRFLVIP